MRDLIVLGMMVLLIPISLRSGYVAFLLWCWAGLASVSTYLYGFMIGFQYSMAFAVIALAKFVLSKDSRNLPFENTRTFKLFVLFGIHVVLCAAFAYEGQTRNWEIATNILKTLLFCIMMPMIVTTRYRVHGLVLLIAISTGYHGLVDGLKYVSSGGNHIVYGVAKYGDNNHFAIALVMILPLLLYCYKYAANSLVRFGFVSAIPVIALAVLATRSRGGLICLVAAGIFYIAISRHKFAGLLILALCAMLVLEFAPDDWMERMNTIGNAKEDDSMMGRVAAWRISSAIALANPVFGGGLHAVEIGKVWRSFMDAPNLLWFMRDIGFNVLDTDGRAAHSIYFETMGDLGLVGFGIFVAILINAFVTGRDVIKMASAAGPQLQWAVDLAYAIVISAMAYSVGGALLSAAYFELPYILFMILEVLKLQVKRMVAVPQTA